MGESACLRRSFSDSSSDPRMGEAIRALTDSISFGRFMTESLAWDKWSSFSQNRYLEEAEKFSKPGSVAQKKAYFEAHYKAKKAAAALLNEADATANNVPKPEVAGEIHNSSSSDDTDTGKQQYCMAIDESERQETPNRNTNAPENVVMDEIHDTLTDGVTPDEAQGQEEAPNTQLVAINSSELEEVEMEVAESATVETVTKENQINASGDEGKIELEEVEMEVAESVTVETVTEENQNVEKDQDKLMASENKKMPLKEDLGLRSKKKPEKSTSKSSTHVQASKLPPSHVQKESNVTPSNKKPARDAALDKKRFTPKSLHMSINFASLAGETSKKVSPILQKIRNSRINATKDSSTPTRTPIRSSVSGISRNSSAATTPQSENTRTRMLPDQSISGNGTEQGKWQSILAEQSQPSAVVASGSKSRSPIISSPFRFRSEERVAKRKEFFQKLEEQRNAKGAEKTQMQTKPKVMQERAENEVKKLRHSITAGPWRDMNKEKPEADLKKMRRSVTFKAIHATDSSCETESSSHHMKKIPPTRSQSPKLRRKTTPTTVLDTNSRPPRMPSTRTESSKNPGVGMNKRLPKKNSQENASPNIQL